MTERVSKISDYQKLEAFLTDQIAFNGNAEGCGAYIETMNLQQLKELRVLVQDALIQRLIEYSPSAFAQIFNGGD